MIDGKPTCAECAYMREYCCDYGICTREFTPILVMSFTDMRCQ